MIGARTRSRSARSRSDKVIASCSRPADVYAVGEVVAGGQGVGVIGAQHPLAVGQQLPR